MLAKFKSGLNTDYSILRNRDFVYTSITRSLIQFAKMVRATAMGWFVYQATNDPLCLAWLALCEAIPAIITIIFSGYIADKYGRIKPTVIFCALEIVLTLWLCYLVAQPFTMGILIWIYACSFAFGSVRGFLNTGVLNSLISLVVKREDTQKATAWDGIFIQASFILGPITAGILYDVKDVVWANAIVVPIMVACLFLILRVRDVIIPSVAKTPQTQWQNMTAGFRFIFSNPTLKATVLLDFFAVIFSGVTGLLPVFAKDILHVGPEGLGVLRASISVGSICAGIFLAHYQLRHYVGRKFLYAIMTFCFSLLMFAYSESFYLSAAMLFLSGACDWYGTLIRSTIARLLTPDHLQGRMAAARTFFATSANELSSFESGLAAGLLGTIPSVVFGGVVTLAILAVTSWKSKSLRYLTMEDLLRPKD